MKCDKKVILISILKGEKNEKDFANSWIVS